jgi:hypothetical protein
MQALLRAKAAAEDIAGRSRLVGYLSKRRAKKDLSRENGYNSSADLAPL